jgi:hypothetical protein
MRRLLIVAGIAIALIGVAWPWISRLHPGRLPGDIVVERPGFRFFLPITTMLIVSLVLSVLLWLFRK